MRMSSMDNLVSFEVTPSTPKIRFIASLSDGRTVIQDDRPKQCHAWIRLQRWLKENPSIAITNLRLQRDQLEIKMPANQKGYFYGNKSNALWRGPQHNFIGIGYYDGYKVNIIWYHLPLFNKTQAEERTKEEAGMFLIENADE